MGQEVEFGDVVPDLGFGGELNKLLAWMVFFLLFVDAPSRR